MKKIPVHRGEHVYEADVDDEDYEFLARYRWRASVRRTVIYANASIPEVGFKSLEMHRMVIGDAEEDWQTTMTGFVEHRLDNGKTTYILPKGFTYLRRITVNHKDGNGLNNTRTNLRHLSCRDQVENRRLHYRA